MRNVDVYPRTPAPVRFERNPGGEPDQQNLVAPSHSCHLLVVHSDAAQAEAMSQMAIALGHRTSICTTSTEALRIIARDHAISIVIADAACQPLDATWLANEVSARFGLARPIAVVISAIQQSEAALLAGVRANVADFLIGELSLGKVSESIRRALAKWSAQAHLLRVNAALDAKGLHPADNDHEAARQDPSLTLAKHYAKIRRTRSKFFEPWVLASPTWDILLELSLAALQDEVLSISSVCALSEFPMSTALRHVRQLEQAGMITRAIDAGDRRRCLLRIEPETLATMKRYFEASKA